MKLPLATSALAAAAYALTATAGVASAQADVPTLISVGSVVPIPINYTDPYDGAQLSGYLAVPPSASKGHVIVFPNRHGVSEYEIRRSVMFAEQLGYTAFAADVYGSENYNPPTVDEMSAMAGKYRGNITLSNARIATAIELVKGLDGYGDAANEGVVIAGYCFGGSIVLNHALSGNDDALATIAYHGGIGSVLKDLNTTVSSKVLVYSGGEDFADSTKSIMEMEDALNTGDGVWEISRYSAVQHGFTDFTGEAYNEHVDMRTWESTGRFLEEVFSGAELEADLPNETQGVSWIDEDITYSDPVDNTTLSGFASYPSAITMDADNNTELLPAVVIVHDANGIDAMERTRARMLAADLGYVGFAADIYGPPSSHGYDLSNRTELFALLNKIRDDVPFFVRRIKAGIDAAKAHPRVDPTKIAAIGYCFGGTGVINYAVTGQDDVTAIISFHGGLSKVLMDGYDGAVPTIRAKMSVQSGGDDDAGTRVEDLESALEAGNATWEYARYSDVRHSFTNWNDEQGRYDPRADVRSWESMRGFLAEAFAEVDGDVEVEEVVTTTTPTTTESAAMMTTKATMMPPAASATASPAAVASTTASPVVAATTATTSTAAATTTMHDSHDEDHDSHDEGHDSHDAGHDSHDEDHDSHDEDHDSHDDEDGGGVNVGALSSGGERVLAAAAATPLAALAGASVLGGYFLF